MNLRLGILFMELAMCGVEPQEQCKHRSVPMCTLPLWSIRKMKNGTLVSSVLPYLHALEVSAKDGKNDGTEKQLGVGVAP